jgi:hypothetical protein
VYIASKPNENLPDNATHLEFDVSKDDIASLDLPNEIHGLVYCVGCECRFRCKDAEAAMPGAPNLLPLTVQNRSHLSRTGAAKTARRI